MEEFVAKKRLRQGNPLAPFLFLVVAEGLSGLVREAEDKKLLKGVQVGNRNMRVTLLQYADDTIFVLERMLVTLSW